MEAKTATHSRTIAGHARSRASEAVRGPAGRAPVCRLREVISTVCTITMAHTIMQYRHRVPIE